MRSTLNLPASAVESVREPLDVVIFCGGRGTRLSEKTKEMPKPLVEIGEYPILWHIMKTYSSYNHNRFILALGYKGEMIVEYFLNHHQVMQDFSIYLDDIKLPKAKERWGISFVQTGRESNTARRLLLCKDFIYSKPFMVTYGDGIADIDINRLIAHHNKIKKEEGIIATITITKPYSKFGTVELDGKRISKFRKNPRMNEYIDAGFMVLEPEVFEFILPNENATFDDKLESIAIDGKLGYYIHDGFWHSMDTYKDYMDLNAMWQRDPKWKTWND